MYTTDSETRSEQNLFNSRLIETASVNAELRTEIGRLSYELNVLAQQRDAFIKRIDALEKLASEVVARQGTELVSALRQLLADDGDAVAAAISGLVKRSVNVTGHELW